MASKPKHMMGKSCGYTLLENGDIVVAPAYSDEMERIVVESASVQAVLGAVTRECQVIARNIEERKRRFWNSVKDDYGLDFDSAGWAYEHHSRTLKRIPREKDMTNGK